MKKNKSWWTYKDPIKKQNAEEQAKLDPNSLTDEEIEKALDLPKVPKVPVQPSIYVKTITANNLYGKVLTSPGSEYYSEYSYPSNIKAEYWYSMKSNQVHTPNMIPASETADMEKFQTAMPVLQVDPWVGVDMPTGAGPTSGPITYAPVPAAVPAMWTFEGAKSCINWFQTAAKNCGYHLCLGGSVLNYGSSQKDIDFYFLPLGGKTKVNPKELILFIESAATSKLESIGNNYPGSELPYAYKGKITANWNLFLQRIDVFIMGTQEDADTMTALMPIVIELAGANIQHYKGEESTKFVEVKFKGKPMEFDSDIPF